MHFFLFSFLFKNLNLKKQTKSKIKKILCTGPVHMKTGNHHLFPHFENSQFDLLTILLITIESSTIHTSISKCIILYIPKFHSPKTFQSSICD